MKTSFSALLALLLAWVSVFSVAHAAEPLPVEQAFQVSVARAGEGRAALTWTVAPGHHLYRDQFQVAVQQAGASSTLAIDLPPGIWRDDPDMGRTQVFSSSGHFEFALPSSAQAVSLRYQGCADAGICYPPQQRVVTLDEGVTSFSPAAAPVLSAPSMEGAIEEDLSARLSLWVLCLAFLGGLILNVLPCVLPVLAIKASSLLDLRSSRAGRAGLLSYSLGVVLSFALLGLLLVVFRPEGGSWGFQMQSPWFVATLVVVFMLMGASLVGWWSLPSASSGAVSSWVSRPGSLGDFFAGFLAVVVASPCVGPLMGSALAVAFLLPPASALLLFLAMGLGLAFPALFLALVPRAAALLPRPGAWMEHVRMVLGIPLFLAALWLAWVLSRLLSPQIALAVLLLPLAILATHRLWRARRTSSLPAWRALAAPAALAVLSVALLRPSADPVEAAVPTIASTSSFTPTPVQAIGPYGAQPFSPARLEQLRYQGKTVFVSIGADWCITCKANEVAVLDRPEFSRTLASRNVVWLSGDWTKEDPEIAAFLRARKVVGVPLYLVFRPDGVRQLPQVLTQEEVAKALI